MVAPDPFRRSDLASSSTVQTLLQQANAALARHDLERGETYLQQVLANAPENPAALFFLGHVRRAQQRLPEAIAYYERAIRSQPDQPMAYHHLATLLRTTGRAAEAVPVMRAAEHLAPQDARTQLELGLALADTAEFALAEDAYRKALRLQPALTEASQALSAALIAQTRLQEVEAVVATALNQPTLSPGQRAGLKLNLGIARVQQNRPAEGLALLDEAQSLMPNLPHADYSRANALQGLGRMEAAEQAYRKALQRNPLDLSAHTGLNRLRYRMASPDFLKSYDEAAALYPTASALFAGKADFLFLAGLYEDAQIAYRRALAHTPAHTPWREGLAATLTRLGAFADAAAEYEQVLQTGKPSLAARCGYAECLLRAGDPEKSVRISAEAITHSPHDQLALALWGTGLRQLGDPRETTLNDYNAFVRVYDLEPPDGFSDAQAFHAALNSSLDPLHGDRREHIDQTLRSGTQTLGNLFGTGRDLVERLRTRIDHAVADYIAQMPPQDTHPLLGRRTDNFVYSGSWSVRLSNRGFHTNHVHPKGWISSAYYVDIPTVTRDTVAKPGWLKFGEPSFEAGFADPIRRTVQPLQGRLVLFPSYMWHGTIAFEAPATRTTIAFDVAPAA